MNEYTIKIQIPDGFEPDDGLQPRCPKEGEYFLDDDTAKECHVSFEFNKMVILKKKKPKYKTYIDFDGVVMVDINALKDALSIIEGAVRENSLHSCDRRTIEALKELIK